MAAGSWVSWVFGPLALVGSCVFASAAGPAKPVGVLRAERPRPVLATAAPAARTAWPPGAPIAPPTPPRVSVPSASSPLRLLAHLVGAEAGNQSFRGMAAVAAVVVNRLHHAGFPHTVLGVITEPGQFASVTTGAFWRTPTREAWKAAEAAWRGWDPSEGALYFFNPSMPHSAWMNALPVTVRIGQQVFAR